MLLHIKLNHYMYNLILNIFLTHFLLSFRIYNISKWVTPFLNTMRNHSKPHIFKIIQDECGKAKILWKRWSTDKVNILSKYFHFGSNRV